ncbi:MAG TPA: acyl-CoA dehydrogenase family protein, partial [Polyangiaceae bacterium]
MEFSLSPKQKTLQDMVRGFGRSIVRPQSLQWDREHAVPEEFLARFVEMASSMGGAGAAWGVQG